MTGLSIDLFAGGGGASMGHYIAHARELDVKIYYAPTISKIPLEFFCVVTFAVAPQLRQVTVAVSPDEAYMVSLDLAEPPHASHLNSGPFSRSLGSMIENSTLLTPYRWMLKNFAHYENLIQHLCLIAASYAKALIAANYPLAMPQRTARGPLVEGI